MPPNTAISLQEALRLYTRDPTRGSSGRSCKGPWPHLPFFELLEEPNEPPECMLGLQSPSLQQDRMVFPRAPLRAPITAWTLAWPGQVRAAQSALPAQPLPRRRWARLKAVSRAGRLAALSIPLMPGTTPENPDLLTRCRLLHGGVQASQDCLAGDFGLIGNWTFLPNWGQV